jgi:L-alanine-DL-glutamate epimerase-like enolase superfamily enzyme
VSRRSLDLAVERWPLKKPFAIARGTKTEAVVVVATITDRESGARGRGECVPYARYGETVDGVVAAIDGVRGAIESGAERAEVERQLPPGAARNALDCALWDLEAKASGRRVADLLGMAAPVAVPTAETIAIEPPEAMAAAAAALADRPLLKVKVGADDVLARLRAVRAAAPRPRIVVDANEGWTAELLVALSEPLARLGVTMIEQPLPAGSDDVIAGFRPPLTLCADESCHTEADVVRLADRYQAVNIKLDKAGGLSGALRTATAARRHGLGIMVGCMVATSLAMAPALLLAASADVVDLDGPLWLRRDRDHGLVFDRGWVGPADTTLWG